MVLALHFPLALLRFIVDPFNLQKWTPIAMLAVLRAGGAFVPMDPSHPADRLRGLCESVGAKLMLCSSHLAHLLAGVVDTVLPVGDGVAAELTQTEPRAKQRSAPSTSSSNAAYVIFTSGSTGTPKVSACPWARKPTGILPTTI